MASAFSHALAAIAIGKLFTKKENIKFWILGAVCAILPDADVVSFKLGIPYGHLFGHRGFTHSLFFALLLGIIITRIFFSSVSAFSKKWFFLVFYFFLSTASHAILDAMTTGGLGVAFFAPFENSRYFFPWRPIQVSPIGASKFFSEWGIRVIKSEFVYVGLPCLVIIFATAFIRKRFYSSSNL